jgi:hypothetical protein
MEIYSYTKMLKMRLNVEWFKGHSTSNSDIKSSLNDEAYVYAGESPPSLLPPLKSKTSNFILYQPLEKQTDLG